MRVGRFRTRNYYSQQIAVNGDSYGYAQHMLGDCTNDCGYCREEDDQQGLEYFMLLEMLADEEGGDADE